MKEIIGHRGGRFPGKKSNSLESLTFALSLPFISGIETDLAISKDKILFCYHDYYLPQSKALPEKKTWKEIKENIPFVSSLQELIEKAEHYQKTLVIEIKSYRKTETIIQTLFANYAEKIHKMRFLSNDLAILKKLREQAEMYQQTPYLIYLITDYNFQGEKKLFRPFASSQAIKAAKEEGIKEIAGHWLTFRQRKQKQVKELGMRVGVGQINYQWQQVFTMYADILYTDYPQKFSSAITKRKQKLYKENKVYANL